MPCHPSNVTNAQLGHVLLSINVLIDWAKEDRQHALENDATSTAKDDKRRIRALKKARSPGGVQAMNLIPKHAFVTVRSLGLNRKNEPDIILSIYGPQGGARAIECISVEHAKELVKQLQDAIEKLKAQP